MPINQGLVRRRKYCSCCVHCTPCHEYIYLIIKYIAENRLMRNIERIAWSLLKIVCIFARTRINSIRTHIFHSYLRSFSYQYSVITLIGNAIVAVFRFACAILPSFSVLCLCSVISWSRIVASSVPQHYGIQKEKKAHPKMPHEHKFMDFQNKSFTRSTPNELVQICTHTHTHMK